MDTQQPLPSLPWNIYWINLERRGDRKTYMERILVNNKHFRVNAIDAKSDLNKYNVLSTRFRLSNGQYACTMSHISALNAYLNNTNDTHPYCFIAEDDCYTQYCEYWKERHWNLLKEDSGLEILQMCTTGNDYDDPKLHIMNNHSSCTAFYMIKRSIAREIVSTFLINDNTYNFNNSSHNPIADSIIWKFGNTKLIPMICASTIDENSSDISPHVNRYENEHWENLFKGAIKKYLDYWKNL